MEKVSFVTMKMFATKAAVKKLREVFNHVGILEGSFDICPAKKKKKQRDVEK